MVRSKLLLLLLFIFFTIKVFAQHEKSSRLINPNQFYVGVEGSGVMNFSYFKDNQVVDQGLRKPPLPTLAWGLALRQNLTSRFSLETGISIIDFGYKSVYTSDYPGGERWEAQTTGTSKFGQIQVPVRVLWVLPGIDSSWRKYMSLGTNVFYNEYWDITGNVGGFHSFPGPNPGDSFTFRDSRHPAPRISLGLTLGLGIERNLGSWGMFQFGAVSNFGFRPIAVWDLEYTTWDISPAVDGINYRNIIKNRGNYVGLRMSLLVKI